MKILQSAMNIQPNDQEQAYVAAMTGQDVWFMLDKGFLPVGLVMGSTIYGVGSLTNFIATAKGSLGGEVKEFPEALYQARALAFSRMQFEADQLGADGVIGIDMKMQFLHDNEWMEVIAIGTAVRYVGSGPNKPPTDRGKVVIPTN